MISTGSHDHGNGNHQKLHILVVDDEKELRESLAHTLTRMGHHVVQAENGEDALKFTTERTHSIESIDLVLLDVNLPGLSGLEVLRRIRNMDASISVLIITAHGKVRDAVEAMQEGAFNYLEKPIHPQDLKDGIEKATQARSLVREIQLSSPNLKFETGEEFIGKSSEMKALFQVIQRVGKVNTSVLITGEDGTGKELVAKAIHYNSTRKDRPFVAVNCAAIPDNLVESEFFGHEKGAFTGADQRHIGKFQYAEGGTLFLDEIGDLNIGLQAKLLRVLQERRFAPIGSNREIRSDIRVVAATNQNLESMIQEGRFRKDLYYRLNVMPIQLPPLRKRREDIPNLVNHFIEKFNFLHDRAKTCNPIIAIDPDAQSALMAYSWPGNIRELENIVERAFVFENGTTLSLDSLPQEFREEAPVKTEGRPFEISEIPVDSNSQQQCLDYQDEKSQFEKEFIVRALKRHHGKINETVAHSGIPKNTLLRKIKKYSIRPSEYGSDKSG